MLTAGMIKEDDMRRKFIGSHILLMKKDVHASVRFDSRIYSYVMGFEGRNFSDRLENLILDHAELSDRSLDLLH